MGGGSAPATRAGSISGQLRLVDEDGRARRQAVQHTGAAEGMGWSDAFQDFVKIWVVVDPIGTVPVFLAVTAG